MYTNRIGLVKHDAYITHHEKEAWMKVFSLIAVVQDDCSEQLGNRRAAPMDRAARHCSSNKCAET